MEENQNKNLLKKLLDRLQEDSWQLELLVSGFTIFGLFYALGPAKAAFQKAANEGDMLSDVYSIVFIAISILILNLIIHVTLRSLWIGALGLRYLSGEVEIDKLNYDARFTVYLKKKLVRLTIISRNSKNCAVSFLLFPFCSSFM